MQYINSQTGWMVGYDGLIIKTTSGGEVVSLNNISSTLPKEFSVLQNYPNPFNPSTVIRFQIASNNFVKLVIYDVLGREVAKLVNQQMQPGSYSVDWDASNYSSGVYFYKLEAGDYTQTRKMVLIKQYWKLIDMKTLFSIVVISFLVNFGYATDTTSAKYYPLQVGNRQVYNHYWHWSGDTRFYVWVTDTINTNGHKYCKMHVMQHPPENGFYDQYVRVDSIAGNIRLLDTAYSCPWLIREQIA